MKIVLVGLTCLVIGFGLSYSYTQYQKVQQENTQLKKQAEQNTKQNPSTKNEDLTNSEPQPMTDVGEIEGILGYPSSGIPPLEVYAIHRETDERYMIGTKQNQMEFMFPELPVGTYHVVAYTLDGGLSGGYTKAVKCGLSVECTDHSLIDVEVKKGETTKGVEVKDWYAPEGTFPERPISLPQE